VGLGCIGVVCILLAMHHFLFLRITQSSHVCSIRQKCREFAIALLIFLQLYSCSGSLAYLDYRQGKRASTEWFLYSDWGLKVVGLFWVCPDNRAGGGRCGNRVGV